MYELLPLLPLALASLEDLKYKAVPDCINYFMLIFTYLFAIYLFLTKGIVPKNLVPAIVLLVLFFLMYLLKFLAIGDLFLMLWLIYFIGFFNVIKILEFLVFMFVSGFIVAIAYSVWILRKNNEKPMDLYISIILSTFSLTGLWLLYKNLDLDTTKYTAYILSLVVAFLIYKRRESEIKNRLIFKRTPNELIEGDWICEPIRISRIPEELKDLVNKNFNVKEENGRILIYPRENLIYGSKGLSKSHIEILKRLYSYEKFVVSVKEGFPLVPAIFLGYLLALLC